MILKRTLKVLNPETRLVSVFVSGIALDVRRTLYWAGGEAVGAKQGTDLPPSSSRPWVLRVHIKQDPRFFDTSPLH